MKDGRGQTDLSLALECEGEREAGHGRTMLTPCNGKGAFPENGRVRRMPADG